MMKEVSEKKKKQHKTLVVQNSAVPISIAYGLYQIVQPRNPDSFGEVIQPGTISAQGHVPSSLLLFILYYVTIFLWVKCFLLMLCFTNADKRCGDQCNFFCNNLAIPTDITKVILS